VVEQQFAAVILVVVEQQFAAVMLIVVGNLQLSC
jgi:hypothetical protein